MSTGGYIKIHRSMLDWEWYQDDRCVRLLLHLHLKANYSPGRWKGKEVGAGQMVTSSFQLAGQLGWSRSAVIRTMDKLKMCGEVDTTSDNKWTLVTLRKWDKFQVDPKKPDSKRVSNRTANGQQTREQPDTIEEGEEEEEEQAFKKEKHSSQLPLSGITEEAPKGFGDRRINELMAFLKAENDGMMDGSVKANRYACANLIRKAESNRPDLDPVTGIKALIARGKLVSFHGPKITSFTYLLAHLVEIKNLINKPANNGKPSTIDQKRAAIAELFAEDIRAAEAGGGYANPQPEGL